VTGPTTITAWSEADLEARLGRALDIGKQAIAVFASDGYLDSETPENSFRPEKLIAETAMLIYAASGARRLPSVASRIDEMARLLVPLARSPRTLLSAALHPSLCIDFAVPHILLSKLGYADRHVDDFLRSCLTSQTRDGHERPPFGVVEQRWITSLWNDTRSEESWNGDLLCSVLNRPIDILGGLRDDVYAFTHLLMYCTDFGFQTARLPRPLSVILENASALLARCLDGEDYDLAGEIIMAWPLTSAPWSSTATFGFRVLANVEDQVGVLPGGTTKVDRLERLEGRARTMFALGTAYHTAYVMGMICATSLRPARAPPVRLLGPVFDEGLLDHLLTVLDSDQGHWQAVVLKLPDAERNSLGPLLLDIAIVQKCRKHDYHAVKELLLAASRYGIAGSPICGQAAELLGRLAKYSQAMESRPEMRLGG
jgi:hypothetical protein